MSDYGPSLKMTKKGVNVRWGGASEVEIADVPDIDAPNRTVRRARRIDPLMRILGQGNIDPKRWQDIDRRAYAAAEQYRDDAVMASGASLGRDNMGIRAGNAGYGPGDTQVAALARMRAVDEIMTSDNSHVLAHLVLGQMGAKEYARVRECRDGTVRPRLLVALCRLMDHYNL